MAPITPNCPVKLGNRFVDRFPAAFARRCIRFEMKRRGCGNVEHDCSAKNICPLGNG